MITTDLKEGGADILVNQENKREYVDLYADFLLNKNVEKQFLAFQRGFNLVTSESPLQMMLTPHELEMLICGEKEFDFNELENSTEYDGGGSAEPRDALLLHLCKAKRKQRGVTTSRPPPPQPPPPPPPPPLPLVPSRLATIALFCTVTRITTTFRESSPS